MGSIRTPAGVRLRTSPRRGTTARLTPTLSPIRSIQSISPPRGNTVAVIAYPGRTRTKRRASANRSGPSPVPAMTARARMHIAATANRSSGRSRNPTRIEGVLAAPSFKNFASPRSHLGSEPLQRQGVRDDGDGAEAHRGSREDRVQEDAEAHKDARRHRDQGGVVEERPEQVRLDLAYGPLAQLDRRDDVPEVVLQEDDPARLHRDIRPAPEGDPDVRLGEGGRVVDPVPDHRDDPASRLELPDLVRLLPGEDLREDLVDAELPRDRLRGPAVVPGEQGDPQPHPLQRGDRGGGVLLQRVRDRDDPRHTSVDREEHRGLPLPLEAVEGRFRGLQRDPRLPHEPPVPQEDGGAVDRRPPRTRRGP